MADRHSISVLIYPGSELVQFQSGFINRRWHIGFLTEVLKVYGGGRGPNGRFWVEFFNAFVITFLSSFVLIPSQSCHSGPHLKLSLAYLLTSITNLVPAKLARSGPTLSFRDGRQSNVLVLGLNRPWPDLDQTRIGGCSMGSIWRRVGRITTKKVGRPYDWIWSLAYEEWSRFPWFA